jgi:general secretion pathway protein B
MLVVMLALFILKKNGPAPVNSSTVTLPSARLEPTTQPQPPNPEQTAAKSASSGTVPAKAKTPVAPAKPEKASRQVATLSPAESRDLVISGIAWQDERRLRRAVVNGELVSEGSEIAGSRVIDIRENRIRFSRNGRLFDVPYASAFIR